MDISKIPDRVRASLDELEIDVHIGGELSKGGFGYVFEGTYMDKNVAIKVEFPTKSKAVQPLQNEAIVYKYHMGSPKNGRRYLGIPRCYFYKSFEEFNVMIMHRMGPNLKEVHAEKKHRFSTITCCLIAVQALDHLKFVHSQGFVHRDIKPANFVLGSERTPFSQSCVFLLDFGLTKRYIDETTGRHLPDIVSKNVTGTLRYMGVHALHRKNPSRRDDLQALAHTLIFFSKGKLPWQEISGHIPKDRKRALVQKMKERLSPPELCHGLDPIFSVFTSYANSLGFMEQPDYVYMKNLFLSYLRYLKVGLNYGFLDWVREPVKMKKKKLRNLHQPNVGRTPRNPTENRNV